MKHALLVLLTVAALASAGESPVLVRKDGMGITWTVTADGLSSIRLGDREIATGGWRLSNGEGIFKAGTGRVDAKTVVKKSIKLLGDYGAVVRHEHKDVIAVYEYVFDRDEVKIAARVENRHTWEPMRVACFHGLTFDFGSGPRGLPTPWHVSYLQHHGVGLCYPSFNVRIGGSWAAGDGFGVGLSPGQVTPERWLFWWDYASWAADQRDKVPRRKLHWLVPAEIPPQGARTFILRMRVSPNADWKHLLEPWKQQLRSARGEIRYKADHRPMVQTCANKSVQYITPQNPYGFHDGARRLDLAEGVAKYCEWLIADMRTARCQGVLFWGQGGEDPRGAMYRPDFDILPPEVEANWPTLVKRFGAAGLRIGACARPGEIAYRIDRTRDGTVRINPDDPAHLKMMIRRFKRMTALGCTAFYLDTFGADLADVKAMRAYREAIGPGIQTYVEHACDAILPHSGLYTELHFDKKTKQYGLAWMSVETWEQLRWLVPGVQCVVKSRVNLNDLPDGVERPLPFLFRHRMTPLVDDWLLRRDADELEALTAKHLDAKGQWKE